MHELSIACGIVEIAERAVRDAGATAATAVHVRVGALSGVAAEALAFCYDVAVRGTALEGSRLELTIAPVVLHCPLCDREAALAGVYPLVCPSCGHPSADVRGGRELEVESIELP